MTSLTLAIPAVEPLFLPDFEPAATPIAKPSAATDTDTVEAADRDPPGSGTSLTGVAEAVEAEGPVVPTEDTSVGPISSGSTVTAPTVANNATAPEAASANDPDV